MTDEDLAPATRVVALGRQDRLPGAGVNAPLEFSSTYIADGPVNYARAGNPTWSAFEEALGALEGGDALVFASGMAAIAAAVSLVAHGGTVVVPAHAYNGTTALLDELEKAGAVRVRRRVCRGRAGGGRRPRRRRPAVDRVAHQPACSRSSTCRPSARAAARSGACSPSATTRSPPLWSSVPSRLGADVVCTR